MRRTLILMAALAMLVMAVGCGNAQSQEKQDGKQPAPAITASPAPSAMEKVEREIQRGRFKEAESEAYGISSISERDEALKKVMDAAIKFEEFETAYNAAFRIRESKLKDQGLETVVTAALARDRFSTASEAAQYIPGKRGQELLMQIMNVAAERGRFGEAMSAAGKIENPSQREAAVKELVSSAAAQGYDSQQIYWYSTSSETTRNVVFQMMRQKDPTWTPPQGR